MDFAHSPQALALRQRLEAFMQRFVVPHNAAWQRALQEGVYPPAFLEDLKGVPSASASWPWNWPPRALERPRAGTESAYFTTPEQMLAEPRIR